MAPASKRREYISLAILGAVLVAAVFVVRTYADSIRAFIDQHAFWGLFLYLILNILDAVMAPGATLPLIPVAAHGWWCPRPGTVRGGGKCMPGKLRLTWAGFVLVGVLSLGCCRFAERWCEPRNGCGSASALCCHGCITA